MNNKEISLQDKLITFFSFVVLSMIFSARGYWMLHLTTVLSCWTSVTIIPEHLVWTSKQKCMMVWHGLVNSNKSNLKQFIIMVFDFDSCNLYIRISSSTVCYLMFVFILTSRSDIALVAGWV